MDELLLRIGVENHLQYNCYPPVTLQMTDFCIRAIKHAENGEYDAVLEFPNGSMTAGQIIEELHLGDFVQNEAE